MGQKLVLGPDVRAHHVPLSSSATFRVSSIRGGTKHWHRASPFNCNVLFLHPGGTKTIPGISAQLQCYPSPSLGRGAMYRATQLSCNCSHFLQPLTVGRHDVATLATNMTMPKTNFTLHHELGWRTTSSQIFIAGTV